MWEELKKDLAEDNISHAYLLYGEEEAVKQTAMDFALALNCLAPAEKRPCHRCRHCILGAEESFSDFLILRPEKTAYTIKQIRQLIKNSQFTAQEGRYRVFMLTEAEKLNDITANALLKTLEEPCPNTLFLLLSANQDRTLATIESRCRIIRQKIQSAPINHEILKEAYKLLRELPDSSIEYIFQLSQQYTSENNKTRLKDNLITLCQGLTEILSRNYGYRQGMPAEKDYLLPPSYNTQLIMELWQEVNKALEYLEYQVNTALLVENLLLTLREKPRLTLGATERRG